MVSEERLKMMIDLARYETGSGQKDLNLRQYYRTDYIALEIIKAFFLATVAYILLLGLLIAGNIEFLLEHLDTTDVRLLVSWLLIAYIVFIAVYIAITYINAVLKYRKARKSVHGYEQKLKELEEASRKKDATESLMELFDMRTTK